MRYPAPCPSGTPLQHNETMKAPIITVLTGLTAVHADTTYTDAFDYPDGPIVSALQSPWIHTSGSENEIPVSGNTLQLNATGSEDIRVPLDPGDTAPGSWFARFTLSVDAEPSNSGAYFAHFISGSRTFRGRLLVRSPEAGEVQVGIASDGSASVFADTTLQPGTSHTLVIAYHSGTGRTELWIDPESGDPPLIDILPSGAGVEPSGFAWRQAAGIGSLIVDDLVIATTLAEALETDSRQPWIVQHPASTGIVSGADAVLNAQVRSVSPTEYQWWFHDNPIPGATEPTLRLESAGPGDSGDYWIEAGNPFGRIQSRKARIVIEPDPAHAPTILAETSLARAIAPDEETSIDNAPDHAVVPGELLRVRVRINSGDASPLELEPVIEPSISEATWIETSSEPGAAEGRFEIRPSPANQGRSIQFHLRASTPSGETVENWQVYVPTSLEQALVISEFLPHPSTDPLAPRFNPLNRETPAVASRIGAEDEFVELVNTGVASIDLAGWTLSDSIEVRHVFKGEAVLEPQGVFVVFGGAESGSAPRVPEGTRVWRAEVTPLVGLGLNNAGDSLELRNASGTLVTRVAFGDTSRIEGSLARSPFPGGPFTDHHAISASAVSPGTRSDGSAFSHPDPGVAPRLHVRSITATGAELIGLPVDTGLWELQVSDRPLGPFETDLSARPVETDGGAVEVDTPPTGGSRFWRAVRR